MRNALAIVALVAVLLGATASVRETSVAASADAVCGAGFRTVFSSAVPDGEPRDLLFAV